MYNGDRARKTTLVEYGFRLPSALDNRPLNFQEFEERVNQTVYVSATPADFEIGKSGNRIIEQVIRPTGLTDPKIAIRPVKGQVDDLLNEIRRHAEAKERVLVTTLTKRMAEDLTEHYKELNVKVAYLHSDVETLERVDIIRDLRLGKYDVLIGINLLREGLDIPEVSLVAILDADKEGFLRSTRSLIQTMGRAARNVNGEVILYAENITDSMRNAIAETNRRRTVQEEYNEKHNITPVVHQEKHPGNAPHRVRAGLLYRADRRRRRRRVRIDREYSRSSSRRSKDRCAPRRRNWISRQRRNSATRSGRSGSRRWLWG